MVLVTTFQVLGQIGVRTERGPVALGGARPRAVLARLLIARGRVVPVDTLVEDLWESPPDGAVAAIRTFVADLRRVLEPDRAPRQPPSLLVTAPPGYALRAQDVDAWRFEALASSSDLEQLDEALNLWKGPAYAEFSSSRWARADIDRLDELRKLAVERRASALLALGRPADAASGLQAHVRAWPLREDAWHLLVRALYRSGRQGEALGALRQARRVLSDELGVDPGPRLKQLEADVLAQASHLSEPVTAVIRSAERPFVGRVAEMAALHDAAKVVASSGQPALVLLAGDAGAGKTALAETLSRKLAAQGWSIVWARSPEYEGAPVAWPYKRGESVSQGQSPVLLIADDVHRANGDGLDLLAALLESADPVLILGTYRPQEVGRQLRAALARFANAEPMRIQLGGLTEDEIAEMAQGQPVAAHAIHERSGGNPFFARELLRLYASGAASGDVPEGVRDVIKHRLSRLPSDAQEVLRRAAVLGRDVDPDVVAAMAGVDVLDPLDEALQAGFLTEAPLRFTHILVRDTLYDDLSSLRRSRWHADAAEALEQVRPDNVAALAYHFLQAGGQDAARKAARYARKAAENAEQRNNPHEAARLWRQAVAAHDRAAPGSPSSERFAASMGLGRALAVTGQLAQTRVLRAQAIKTAAALGDRELLAQVVAGFDVPAIWPRNDDEQLSAQIVAAVEKALPGAPDGLRSRLLSTLALELRGDTGSRGREAALEAERLARALRDPALVALGLNAKFMHSFGRTGKASDRAAIGHELTALAAEYGLVTFEVLGHLMGLQSACAVGDFVDADVHAGAADQLAKVYDLPVVGVFTQLYRSLRLAVAGSPDAQSYREALRRLEGAGMPGMAEGLAGMVELSLRLPPAVSETVELGPYEPWGRPLKLLAIGRQEEAARALHSLPASPHDALREARLALAAYAAVQVGDRAVMASVRDELGPAAGELAGAASGVVSFGPVCDILAMLT